jgi:hypothetical protein
MFTPPAKPVANCGASTGALLMGGAFASNGRMAEVLRRFAQPLFIEDGPGYIAHASQRETTQPNRLDAE